MSPTQALATVDRILSQQAYVLSSNDIFYASAIIFVKYSNPPSSA